MAAIWPGVCGEGVISERAISMPDTALGPAQKTGRLKVAMVTNHRAPYRLDPPTRLRSIGRSATVLRRRSVCGSILSGENAAWVGWVKAGILNVKIKIAY